MRTPLEKAFIRCGFSRKWLFADDVIALRPREYTPCVPRMDGAKSMIFDMVDVSSRKTAGELALRIGEDADSLYYLGHIGYHVDPPYQGQHAAYRACRLALPLLYELGLDPYIITTDEDNLPSIRTCERLGGVLVETVDVPLWCQATFGISARKRRYRCCIPMEVKEPLP